MQGSDPPLLFFLVQHGQDPGGIEISGKAFIVYANMKPWRVHWVLGGN